MSRLLSILDTDLETRPWWLRDRVATSGSHPYALTPKDEYGFPVKTKGSRPWAQIRGSNNAGDWDLAPVETVSKAL